MIFVIATLDVWPEKRSDFARDALAVIKATQAEAGCLSYDLHASVSDANRFVFVERWSSREALSAHFETPHMGHWRRLCADYIQDRTLEVVWPERVESL